MNQHFRLTPARVERLRLLKHLLRDADRALEKVFARGDLRPSMELDRALRNLDALFWAMRISGDYDDGEPFLTDYWLCRLNNGEMRHQRPFEWWERKAEEHNFPSGDDPFSDDGEGDLDES